jgi:hypothetical protein
MAQEAAGALRAMPFDLVPSGRCASPQSTPAAHHGFWSDGLSFGINQPADTWMERHLHMVLARPAAAVRLPRDTARTARRSRMEDARRELSPHAQTMRPHALAEPSTPPRFLQFDARALAMAFAAHSAGLDRAFLELTVDNRIATCMCLITS